MKMAYEQAYACGCELAGGAGGQRGAGENNGGIMKAG